MSFNIVLNLKFLNLNNEHLKCNSVIFLWRFFNRHRHFQTAYFFVLNSLTANIQFLKIQLQIFKMKKKFATSNSIFKIQSAEIQMVQKVGQTSSTGKSR